MKTNLPERSLVIQERLDNIVKEILAVAKDKIAMIILFGSYARGDWVQDVYREGHIIYSYQSDIDILLCLRKSKYRGHIALRVKQDVQKRFKKKGIVLPPRQLPQPLSIEDVREYIREPRVTLIAEPIARVNDQLEKGRYFFTDIKKQGILLYDNGEFQLTEARDLPWEERRQIASEDYEYWFKKGKEFLAFTYYALERGSLNDAAFLLHQSTESFYNTILLVFTGYKPKLHDIEELGADAGTHNAGLITIFPMALSEQSEAFKLLKDAYIEARYNKNYQISKEQLLYLIERVEKLQSMTQTTCLEYINREQG